MTGVGHDDDRNGDVVQFPVRVRRADLVGLLAATEPGGAGTPSTLEDVGQARDAAVRLIRLRRKREAEFGERFFADPAWDILLDLFVRGLDDRATSVSSACIGACVPSTTALRHLAILAEAGLVKRVVSGTDQRVQHVTLTQKAQAIMVRLLTNRS